MGPAHRIVLVCAVVLALVGAGGAFTVKPDDKHVTHAAKPATASPVSLLNAGTAPRILMRLTPPIAQAEKTTQRQEQTLRITVNGQTIQATTPPVELDMTTRVTSIVDHRIHLTQHFDAARVLNGPGVQPNVRASMVQVANSIIGQSVDCVRTDLGQLIHCDHLRISFPDSIKSVGDALINSLETDAPTLLMPFPDQPVGVGAHWTFVPEGKSLSLKTEALLDVTVTRIAGRRVEASIKQSIRFVPGPTKLGAIDANVESGLLSGGGTIAWNLDRIDPNLDTTIEGTSVITTGEGADAQRVEQFQHQSIRVTDRP